MDPTSDTRQTSQEIAPLPRRLPLQRGSYPEPLDFGHQNQATNDDDPRGGLLEYWRILRRRKGTVILLAFAGLIVGVLVTLPQTPIYQAHASLEIQDINNEVVNLRAQSGAATEMGSISNALADVQTQIKILQSESLVERSIAKLATPSNESVSKPSAWRQVLGLPDPGAPGPEQKIKSARNNLKARASGQTRIVEVTFDSADPNYAAAFLNALTNEFIEQNVDARWKMMQRTGDWLTRQLDDVKIKLERSEDALQNYARQSGLVFTGSTGAGNTDSRQNITEEKLHQIQSALTAAQSERVSKQSRYEMAKTASPESLPDVLNDPSLRDYQTKLTDLRRQQAELTATYKPEYSKVKRIEAQIAPVEAALSRERTAILARIRNEYEEALRREKLLSADYASQARQVTGDAEKSIQYNILKREVDTNRQIYETMLQRVKESSIASAMRASNIRIIDPAKAPRRPYKPVASTNGALGLLAGAFLGIAFVVMRERADRSLQEPGDAPFYLGVPELGVIPAADAAGRKRFYSIGKRSEEGDSTTTSAITSRDRVELTTWQRKPSIVAEAFRTVLTSLLFSAQNGHRPRVLVLTSASPGEGKTTVTCNLGIAMAEIKQRTLIIDADLRKPRVHKVFNLSDERGLSTLLQDGSLSGPALEGLILETVVPGLFVLPAGPSTAASSNLLYSAAFGELIQRLRREFETILIDTPPMLQMPDSRVAARSADGVILVARAHRTMRDAAIAAASRFAEDGTRLFGTILNDWNPKVSPNGYYGYYSKYEKSYSQYYTSRSDDQSQ